MSWFGCKEGQKRLTGWNFKAGFGSGMVRVRSKSGQKVEVEVEVEVVWRE